ncbi:MAG: hypothetical protein N2C14_26230, partial [Planctomycetales bacterium]
FTAKTLARTDALLAVEARLSEDTLGLWRFRQKLTELRAEIAETLHAQRGKRHHVPTDVIPPFDPHSPITFHAVPGLKPDWDRLIKCGESLDAMWSAQGVCVMRVKGRLEKVFQPGFREEVVDVAWDGKNLWIATSRSGIRIISPEGKLIDSITSEDGLPPYDVAEGPRPNRISYNWRRLHLWAIEPGRCLAIGRFGAQQRHWFASITQGGESARVNVFHKTTHQRRRIGASSDDPAEIFPVGWMIEHAIPSDPERRLLLVGPQDAWRPLAIDLNSLDVSVFTAALPRDVVSPKAYHSEGGKLVYHGEVDVNGRRRLGIGFLHLPGKEDASRWKHDLALTISTERKRHPIDFSIQVLPHKGNLLVAGRHWARLDARNMKAKFIVPNMPRRHTYFRYAVSAHYGLTAWNEGDRLYQIQIADGSGNFAEVDLESLYPFVPEPHRARHHRAVQRIRQLGGRVDAVWGKRVHDLPEVGWATSRGFKREPGWRTFVYLSSDWTGGDEGLRHLRELRDLRG